MIDKGLGLLALLAFMGFLVLMCIIVAIVKRKERKIRNVALITTILLLLGMVFTGGYLLVKSVLTAKVIVEETASKLVGNEYYTSPMLDSLKLLEPVNANVPPSYYTYFGMRDYYRFPIVYPYSIVGIDALKDATLEDETGIESIIAETNKSKQVLPRIVEFSFDESYFLAETTDLVRPFILIHFATQKQDVFNSKEALMQYAKDRGFVPKQSMINILNYSRKF